MNSSPSSDHQSVETSTRSVLLRDYMREIENTDTLPNDDLQPVLLGLMGEVGSIMAVAKKLRREPSAYPGYQQIFEEEFGDTLWYFTTLCRRLGAGVDEILSETVNPNEFETVVAASDLVEGPISHISSARVSPILNETFLELSKATSALLDVRSLNKPTRDSLRAFSRCYLRSLQAAELTFSTVVSRNIVKARGRFLDPDVSTLPTFDSKFPNYERIPLHFEIKITQRKNGQGYLQWNDVFLGDPLTDNISDPDDYRFHDVFHFANAAILHWSPVFRALIKHKRKSKPKIDKTQDGGRAIVVEEGLTAWIFSRAKELNFFKDPSSISFDMLKTVQQFVQGYEVEECPLKLWEKAILDAYKVFRQVRHNKGGIVIGDRESRTIDYKPLDGE